MANANVVERRETGDLAAAVRALADWESNATALKQAIARSQGVFD
jgi:hypothetical protein